MKNNAFISFPFNGKERDYESGFLYYGARYHWPELWTGWTTPDPMMYEFRQWRNEPSHCESPLAGNRRGWDNASPYNYCNLNPVNLVDPDGLFADDPPTSLRYIIRKGDSFWSLENEWNLPHGTLLSINPSIDPNKIQIGQEINAARNEGNYIVVGNTVHIPEGREAEPPNEEGPSVLMYLASSYDFLSFRMAFDALLPWMTFGIIEGAVGGQHIPKISFGESCRPIRGLGNPFKNKNLTEIDNSLQRNVRQGKLEPAKGCAPGNKAYVTKKLVTHITWIQGTPKNLLI